MNLQNKLCKNVVNINFYLLAFIIALPFVNCWLFSRPISTTPPPIIELTSVYPNVSERVNEKTESDSNSTTHSEEIPHVNDVVWSVDKITAFVSDFIYTTASTVPNISPVFTAIPSEDTSEKTIENGWPIVTCTGCQFSCHSKRLCVEPHLVCDGINDCDDGSDEFSCSDDNSTHFSPVHPNEGQYRDRCCLRASFNDQVCTKEKSPFLIFSKMGNLYKYGNLSDPIFERQNDRTLTGNFEHISAFEYRTHDDLLIWLDPSLNKIFTGKVNLEQIYRSPIFDRKVIVSQQHTIRGFVYDWLNFTIIWIDDYGIRSERIDLFNFAPRNQTKTYRNLKPSYDKPGSITMDVKKQYIFWVNRGKVRNGPHTSPVYIERIDIQSKSKIERVVYSKIVWPVGLVADTEKTKLYWIDNHFQTLNSIEYDGTNRVTLHESLPFSLPDFVSMDIHSNYLYFEASKAIQRINLNNSTIIADGLTPDQYYFKLYIKIIDPIKQEEEDLFREKNMFVDLPLMVDSGLLFYEDVGKIEEPLIQDENFSH